MVDPEGTEHLLLEVSAGEDADERDLLTRELRSELLELGTGSVELASTGEPPPGVKAAEVFTLGALALAVLPSFLPKLLEYLNSWTMRAENRTIKVKTQVGDRSIDLEYTPAAITEEELMLLVSKLTGALADKPGVA
jgi:hypothetical protein